MVNKVLEEKEAEKEEKEAQKREEERLEREKIAEEKKQARLAEEKRIADEKAAEEAEAEKKARANYVFGTKEKPIIKAIYTSKSNQYLPSPDQLYINLDMGESIKVQAIKAKLRCTDVFDEVVVNTEIVDKDVANATVANQTKPEGWLLWKGERGPSTAIQNVVYIKMNSIWDSASKAFGQGGGLDCTVKPSKVVYRN